MKNQTNNLVLTSKFLKKLIFLVTISLFSNANCQKTLSGKLLNQNKKPIEFAILSVNDGFKNGLPSTIIKGPSKILNGLSCS